MTLDMTFEAREKLIRRDERALGIEEGIEQGIVKAACGLLALGKITEEDAMEYLHCTKEELVQYMNYKE